MSNIHDFLVIGNGPSAIHFIKKMALNGKFVTQIDASSDLTYTNFPNIQIQDYKNNVWKQLNLWQNETSIDTNNNFYNFIDYSYGGLTNRWGAGCSKLNNVDLNLNESLFKSISNYYNEAEENISIHYTQNDNLDNYLGVFKKNKKKLNDSINFDFISSRHVIFGKSRKAILTKKIPFRNLCNNCGGCNVHCFNNSIYNARFENIPKNTVIYKEFKAIKIKRKKNLLFEVTIKNKSEIKIILAKNLILAAGALETNKLVSNYLKESSVTIENIPIKHNPMCRAVYITFGKKSNYFSPAGMDVAKVEINKGFNSYVSITSGTSIPTSDFMTLTNFKNKFMRLIFDNIKKYIIVSLVFLPSDFSSSIMRNNKIYNKFSLVRIYFFLVVLLKLSHAMLKNKYFLIFVQLMKKGSDMHHGGTFPIGTKKHLTVNTNCELNGHTNLFIIDGSWLPRIPEKPHTFTLIANAYRIADYISKR